MNRRGFLQGILAAATAPYVVTSAGVLMPIKKIIIPSNWLNQDAIAEALLEIGNLADANGVRIGITPHYMWVTNGFIAKAKTLGYNFAIVNPGLNGNPSRLSINEVGHLMVKE